MNSSFASKLSVQGNIGFQGFPGPQSYSITDPHVSSWIRRVKDYSGETVPTDFAVAVEQFVKDLKNDGLWNLFYEMYLFCGVSVSSINVKLKTYPGKSNILTISGISSSSYNATGTNAGIVGDGASARSVQTGILGSDIPVHNRSVGVYETVRAPVFYATLIGRQRGGGNSAFGPTVNPGGDSALRVLDNISDTTSVGSLNSSATASGLFAAVEGNGTVALYNHRTISKGTKYTGDIATPNNGYVIGGAIGGGAYMASTVSFGFIAQAMTDNELRVFDDALNKLMTVVGCNKY